MNEGMPTTQSELETLLNERIQAKTGEAVTNAVKDVLAKNGAKRLPDAMSYNKEAIGASEDGKFASRGEFFRWVPGAGGVPTRPHDDSAGAVNHSAPCFHDANGFQSTPHPFHQGHFSRDQRVRWSVCILGF